MMRDPYEARMRKHCADRCGLRAGGKGEDGMTSKSLAPQNGAG